MPSRSAGLDAVTIDAFGTLVELENPVGRLQAALAERGVERDQQTVGAAFAAEVEYYLVHKGEGKDDSSLLDLRNRCSGVFLAGAVSELDAQEFAPAFVGSLVFRPLDGVVDALRRLRRAGLELAWRLGVEPARALHIGDDEADEAGARAASLGFEPPPLATLPARLDL
jgi:FMN phosphatase YigB (HAD superfamily)